MASWLHDRSPGCWLQVSKSWFDGVCLWAAEFTWCISTVTVPPALAWHFPLTGRVPALQTMSLPPTFVTGELDCGMRTQEDPCCEGQCLTHCYFTSSDGRQRGDKC
ncbi:hypothetical protein VTK56DRAFT_8140 [Thermocarpiscus australiensis]